MTQEEKQLLLKDLCARLPYGVKVNVWEYVNAETLVGLDINKQTFNLEYAIGQPIFSRHNDLIIKPYLHPMSSMTEEEKEELKQEHIKDEKLYAECLTKAANGDNSMRGKVIPHFAADWCNKNHFDYRGLIPMGLALEAKEGMYKNE